ncbi:L,D-transpeptidase [Mycobacterium avium]|uniref:L,D-transpeptidase n=3 Tax=Mycobacterium avium TaxID=1764 RepID=A0A3B6X2R2_MYCAV|nr:L,D-transpeptidase [Mycobacterium avium]ETA95829.1 membrane protein [Mycobacterium avium 05-4293]ETB01582.1 membrane protein [Mycobacterium avium 10-5581]ETB15612.1 membrane protein [Mycobacterium avium subsp. silvaticum ATCC 49884]ETB21822.1 membrane protein [Mycobacterium avium subsp. avium 10-9275]ETB24203.1 membrane protein [Mycobacterium avium subsp. avium 11-4751]ETB49894.1 membrane protein [Mycobacterium avium 10-5560]ETB51819.1 membrane protein [Mycobacterium avium 11-0986]
MRRAGRYLFVMVAITVMALVAPVGRGGASVPLPQPVPGIASILPANGAVVGVAHPIVVTFTAPAADRAAVERSIHVVSPAGVRGHFEWADDNTVVRFVPNRYWPAHGHVSVGVQALTTGFDTGDALLGVASISKHTFTVSRNGEVLRTMPASMGKPSRPTPIGNFTALEKQRSVVMDSRTIGIPLSSPEGYKITAQYAVRVTWSGVYVHSAPWSVDSQGYANVSHGCINLSPDNAAWYFNEVNVGDPIQVVA